MSTVTASDSDTRHFSGCPRSPAPPGSDGRDRHRGRRIVVTDGDPAPVGAADDRTANRSSPARNRTTCRCHRVRPSPRSVRRCPAAWTHCHQPVPALPVAGPSTYTRPRPLPPRPVTFTEPGRCARPSRPRPRSSGRRPRAQRVRPHRRCPGPPAPRVHQLSGPAGGRTRRQLHRLDRTPRSSPARSAADNGARISRAPSDAVRLTAGQPVHRDAAEPPPCRRRPVSVTSSRAPRGVRRHEQPQRQRLRTGQRYSAASRSPGWGAGAVSSAARDRVAGPPPPGVS